MLLGCACRRSNLPCARNHKTGPTFLTKFSLAPPSGHGCPHLWVMDLSGTGDSRESFAIKTPIFIARQTDSRESFEFPIRANHATKVMDVGTDMILVAEFKGLTVAFDPGRPPNEPRISTEDICPTLTSSLGCFFVPHHSVRPRFLTCITWHFTTVGAEDTMKGPALISGW